jgi:hypothetical protein
MKAAASSVLAILLLASSLVALTNAFLPRGSSLPAAGKAVPRLSDQRQATVVVVQQQQQQRRRHHPNTNYNNNNNPLVLRNALREYANWNDVWDGDYGYGGYGGMGMSGGGGYGPYRSGYRRGYGGGGYGGGGVG